MSPEPTARLLLVDDVEENLVALSAVLARSGVELTTARSGEEALEALLVDDFALALIDVHMPGMDGFELAELMRGAERTRRIPIIFITAATDETARIFKGYEAGAVDFLFKPVDPRLLRSKVDTFVQLHRQKQRLSEQLDQLNQMLRLGDMLVAVLGHDLRGPLQSIEMAAQVALSRTGDQAAIRQAMGAVRKSTQRMARLIDQLLDFARARTQGGIPVEPGPCDLHDLARSVVAELDSAASDRVQIATRGSLQGTWDADRILQVVDNLTRNAAAHGSPEGPIRIDLDGSDPDQVRIEVHNLGHIPPERASSLFDPFTRVHDQRSRSEGLGLGLYIVDQLARSHGGRVSLSSQPSTGTSFVVTLPRHRSAGS
jgi:two-component system, sensor histidine kinase and response regulator